MPNYQAENRRWTVPTFFWNSTAAAGTLVDCVREVPALKSWNPATRVPTRVGVVPAWLYTYVHDARSGAGRRPAGGRGSLAAGLCRAAPACAARLARQPPGDNLEPTDLVHEAYLRIAGDRSVTWEGRQHFFFAVVWAMRDIMVNRRGTGRAKAWRRPQPPEAGRCVRPAQAPLRRCARSPRGALSRPEVRDALKARIACSAISPA